MKKEIDSVVLVNKAGQRLRIYKVEGTNTFCIGLEGQDHFEFEANTHNEIIDAICMVVDSFED